MTQPRPLIYGESPPAQAAYQLTDTMVRESLGAAATDYEIVVRPAGEPDAALLRRAEFFVAPRFDTVRLRESGAALKLVHCLNAGIEKYMPIDWLRPDVVLTNSSGIHADRVGEYAMMALLMLNQQLPAMLDAQRARQWQPRLSMPVGGKHVVIVGTGGLGASIARHARLLRLRTTGVSRSGSAVEGFDKVVGVAQLDDEIAQADFVVLACPLTEHTRGLFDRARLARMKPGSSIVNVGRGALLDGVALAEAIDAGQMGGAVLDVLDPEPLPADSPLWHQPRVVITPHISCDIPHGYIERGLTIFADNLARLRRGAPLLNVVDRHSGY